MYLPYDKQSQNATQLRNNSSIYNPSRDGGGTDFFIEFFIEDVVGGFHGGDVLGGGVVVIL